MLSTDAYVIVYADNTEIGKTSIVRNSLHPVWNMYFSSLLFKKSTLYLKLYDNDTFNEDDFLGQITVDMKKISRKDEVEIMQLPVEKSTSEFEAKGTMTYSAYVVVSIL